MTIPDKLPIMRIEDDHTHYLGKFGDGQLFWGYLTFAFTKSYSEIEQGDDWKKFRKEYALLHKFDNEGNYLETKYWSGLATEVDGQVLEDKLQKMVNQLGDIDFQDIEIGLFQTQLDNIIFGLIIDEENATINLQPSSTISFQEPWDGEYYT
jgi:hypothetical protein